ncbi:MAG: hypothetical protein ABSG78_13250 [Verrucomicrobiota bacterium]|jgi:hypothetical protein
MNIIKWRWKRLTEAVLKLKRRLVRKLRSPKREIFVILEGGLVQEIVNLPPNINVTVLDYDTEGADKEDLQISPVDGELCVINKW